MTKQDPLDILLQNLQQQFDMRKNVVKFGLQDKILHIDFLKPEHNELLVHYNQAQNTYACEFGTNNNHLYLSSPYELLVLQDILGIIEKSQYQID